MELVVQLLFFSLDQNEWPASSSALILTSPLFGHTNSLYFLNMPFTSLLQCHWTFCFKHLLPVFSVWWKPNLHLTCSSLAFIQKNVLITPGYSHSVLRALITSSSQLCHGIYSFSQYVMSSYQEDGILRWISYFLVGFQSLAGETTQVKKKRPPQF